LTKCTLIILLVKGLRIHIYEYLEIGDAASCLLPLNTFAASGNIIKHKEGRSVVELIAILETLHKSGKPGNNNSGDVPELHEINVPVACTELFESSAHVPFQFVEMPDNRKCETSRWWQRRVVSSRAEGAVQQVTQ